jgi:O-antigen/teichoic acid export membrane protein
LKNATAIGRISARGSVTVSFGLVVSNLIMALGTFLVAGFLSASDYGLYAIVLTVPSVFGLFQDLGINSAIVKYTAQYRADNESEKIKRILSTALIFDAVMGAGLSLIAFLSANFLAVTVLGRPEIESSIAIASVIILASSMVTAIQSIFTGFETMGFYASTLVIFSILKTFMASTLVIAGFGVNGAVTGYLVASAATALIGSAFFFFGIYRKVRSEIRFLDWQFKGSLSLMIKYGFPLSVSAILNGFLVQFYNFLLYRVEPNNAAIGSYQMAGNFMVFMGFLTTPIAVMLFPAFSKLNSEKDKEILKRVFQLSVKYASILVVPAAVALMILAQPLVGTLFGDKYSSAPFYLLILTIQGLYVGVGSLSITNLINGQGRTNVTLKLTLLTFVIGITLSLFLIPSFGIVGLIITSLISGFPSLIAGSWWIKRHFTTSIDKSASGKIYLSSGLAGISTHFILLGLSWLPFWISLTIGGLLFVSLYLGFVLFARALDNNDILSLRAMLGETGPLRRIVEPFLKIFEKPITNEKHKD